MGYIAVSGVCIGCGQNFYFHPNKVPSVQGHPVCKECIDKILEFLNSITKVKQ